MYLYLNEIGCLKKQDWFSMGGGLPISFKFIFFKAPSLPNISWFPETGVGKSLFLKVSCVFFCLTTEEWLIQTTSKQKHVS